jgi:DNA-binding MarR family transcriptional regulator
MTSGELARALKLDAGTLTPMLKRLALSGLIERTRRVDDERVIDNRLTERGQALQQNLLRTQNGVMCKTSMPASEIDALRNILHELSQRLSHSVDVALEPA